MNNQESLGYSESQKNGEGIIRARTTGQLRLWKIPRTLRAIEGLYGEFGRQDFPGIYLLFDKKKIDVGESKNLYNRLTTHLKNPDNKRVPNWTEAVVISDGRIATLSDFNDTVVRLALEYHINLLMKANRFEIKSGTEEQTPTASQKQTINSLKREIDFILLKQNIIQKPLPESGQEEILTDELKKTLKSKGFGIDEKKWRAKLAIVDRKKFFIRPGSPKKKGWQITFRGSFKKAFQEEQGYLLIPRGGIFLIPFSELKTIIGDSSAFKQDTIDMYVSYKSDGTIEISYKENRKDITSFNILQ